MFTIGEFAQHGRVSVRMLRHYDAIGLLRPACVDPATGYRSYQVSQLAELNRLIALKELGFSLRQVRAIMAEQVSVEARLATIEDEDRAPGDAVVVKRLPPVRVAELTGTAAGCEPAARLGAGAGTRLGHVGGRGRRALGKRVEFYRTNPAEEPDMNKWVAQLAFRLADG
jgi:DNA-binding transcriptional MerR regulator